MKTIISTLSIVALFLVGCSDDPYAAAREKTNQLCSDSGDVDLVIEPEWDTDQPVNIWFQHEGPSDLASIRVTNCSPDWIGLIAQPVRFTGVDEPFVRENGTVLSTLLVGSEGNQKQIDLNTEAEHAPDGSSASVTYAAENGSRLGLPIPPKNHDFDYVLGEGWVSSWSVMSTEGILSSIAWKDEFDVTLGHEDASPWKNVFTHLDPNTLKAGEVVPPERIKGGAITRRVIVE